MFEVIPNWHPIFVHFTIALLSMSAVFFVALKFIKNESAQEPLETMAYWNLWIGTGFAVVTAIAGWFAYNSVAHDTPSHEAMTDHRNWAIITLSVFVIATVWSLKEYKKVNRVSASFVFVMVMAFMLLLSTGWRGSEAVYRYGLGVMSLPKIEGEGHAHEHENINSEDHSAVDAVEVIKPAENKMSKQEKPHDHTGHEH